VLDDPTGHGLGKRDQAFHELFAPVHILFLGLRPRMDEAEVEAAQVEALREAGPVPFRFTRGLSDGAGFFRGGVDACGSETVISGGRHGVTPLAGCAGWSQGPPRVGTLQLSLNATRE